MISVNYPVNVGVVNLFCIHVGLRTQTKVFQNNFLCLNDNIWGFCDLCHNK